MGPGLVLCSIERGRKYSIMTASCGHWRRKSIGKNPTKRGSVLSVAIREVYRYTGTRTTYLNNEEEEMVIHVQGLVLEFLSDLLTCHTWSVLFQLAKLCALLGPIVRWIQATNSSLQSKPRSCLLCSLRFAINLSKQGPQPSVP